MVVVLVSFCCMTNHLQHLVAYKHYSHNSVVGWSVPKVWGGLSGAGLSTASTLG